MTTRDSSVNAIAELRTLRLARIRERVEAEREQKEEAARAQAQREAEAARLAAERAAEAAAQIEQAEQASEPEPRTSRTTLERIADMRHELRALARERAEALSAREARIEALMVRVAEQPTHWAPQVTTLMVAAGVFIGLVLQAPAPEVVSTAVPAAPPEMAETTADAPGVVGDTVREASEVALLEEAEIPLIAEEAASATEAAPEPAVAPRRKPKRVPATKASRTSKSSKSAPALDALGNLADCGDDPICGLGL